ncbi:MAG: ferredoxin-like protein [Clostridiales bacterium]|nr:ferredoxin-like protein [Clostridia bacterium]MCR4883059.1 ferredoxin-like protein [Clostridiales bacterium]
MSEVQDRKKFLDKDYTRRQFLKISGKSLAGLAISSSLLNVLCVSEKSIAEDKVRVWAFPQGLLVVDMDRCVGCQRCEINCTLTNDGCCSSYISRVKVTRNLYSSRNGQGLYTEDNWTYFPDTCRQCEDPACGNACPMQAIYADENGIRRVDTEKCIGCGACVQACPWHMPTVNPVTHKSSKCIMCGACAEGCPSGALSIVPWDRIVSVSQAM